jgi:exosortase
VDFESLRRWIAPILVTSILLVVLFFLFPFGSGYLTINRPFGPDLWSKWTTLSPGGRDFTYCPFALVLGAYLIFTRRFELSRAPLRGDTAAIFWIILGLLLFWIGSRVGKYLPGYAGIQLVLLGAVLWFWGGAVFRLLAFAWVFLIFTWPLLFMDSFLAFPLRMVVSDLSYHGLNLVGIPSIQHGTALLSAPDQATGLALGSRFQIDIANPCSGVKALMPLLMFSVIYGYFFLPRRWQQLTIFCSALPLIVIGNCVRILLLVIGCITLGTEMALGTNKNPSAYHEGCGYAVFVVFLGLELLLAYGLIALEQHRSKRQTPAPQRQEVQTITPEAAALTPLMIARGTDVAWWRSGVVLGLAAVMLVAHLLTPGHFQYPEAGVLMSLPDQVVVPCLNDATLDGIPARISESELTMLPVSTEFVRKNYVDFGGHNIFLSIVLNGVDEQFSLHDPEDCLVAQGWHIDKEEDVPLRLASGHNLVVRSLLIHTQSLGKFGENQSIKRLYMYWLVADNMTTPSHTMRSLLSSWERILHNRDPQWAYIIVTSPITQSMQADGLNEAQTRLLLQEFIGQVAPVTQRSEMPGKEDWQAGRLYDSSLYAR